MKKRFLLAGIVLGMMACLSMISIFIVLFFMIWLIKEKQGGFRILEFIIGVMLPVTLISIFLIKDFSDFLYAIMPYYLVSNLHTTLLDINFWFFLMDFNFLIYLLIEIILFLIIFLGINIKSKEGILMNLLKSLVVMLIFKPDLNFLEICYLLPLLIILYQQNTDITRNCVFVSSFLIFSNVLIDFLLSASGNWEIINVISRDLVILIFHFGQLAIFYILWINYAFSKRHKREITVSKALSTEI
ncbi:MAG: hypothetical protein ACTSYF_03495 [Promethearchaeota archaeon]